MKLEEIYESLINGKKKQAGKQIKRYGLKKFFIAYPVYLEERFTNGLAFLCLKDAINCIYH